MQFLVDESAGIGVTEYLRTMGHDVLAVAELSPEIDDETVLAWAVREKRILVTNDKDFGELVFRSGQPHRGILLFRLQDESTANRIKVVAAVLQNYAERLPDRFVVVTETSVRVRPLESL
jgi:predicted nuclease of predicted toxin-antitoxin system